MNDPYGLAASGLPPEMVAEAMGLSKREQIMQALLQQSQSPIEAAPNGGRFATRVTPMQGIAKIVQALFAAQGSREGAKGIADFSAKRERMSSDAIKGYEQAKVGMPAVVPATPNDDEGNPMPSSPATKGDPRAAIAQALANPMLRQNPLVLADMKSMEKATEPYSLKQGEKRYIGDQPVAENAPKATEHVINGKVYVMENGKLTEKGGPGDAMAFNRPFNADGTPNKDFQNYELLKGQAGATRVQTNVNAFTPASEEAQRDFMKSTRATYDQLKQAPVLLDSLEKAKSLIPEAKGFMGPGGEGLLTASKFLNNRLGLKIDTEGVKSAEELRTRIFFNIMDNLKKMDAQPSEMQQKIMQEALGNLGTDPNALPQVLDAFGDAIRGRIALHNKEVEGGVARGVKFPYDPTIKLPEPKRRKSDQPGAVIDFSQLPK